MSDDLEVKKEEETQNQNDNTNAKEKDGSGVWYNILNTALKIPGAKLDRDDFLGKIFRDTHKDDALANLLNVGPGRAGVPLETLDKLAEKIIGEHTAIVTGTSFASGLPGGVAMAATIPADVAQFYWHVMVIAQKLAYVYGWPDLRGEDGGDGNEEFLSVLTLLIGVMSDAKEADDALTNLSKALSSEAASKKLPKVIITRIGVPVIAKTIAAKLGARLAAQTAAKGISRIVPIIGGIAAGAVSFVTFKPMTKRLKDALHTNVIKGEQK